MTVKERVSTFEEPLPSGWASATIGKLVTSEGVFIDGDWVESKDQDPDGDVRLIQLADIGDGEYRNRSARFLTLSKARKLGCTFLEPGDVLIARMPDPLGRACIFPGDTKPSVTVVDVCVVRTGAIGADQRWLVYAVNAPAFRSAIGNLQSGTTRQRISRGNLATLELPIPPLTEQQRIVAAIEQQFTRLDAGVAALKSAQTRLKRYRAAVLKAAVEGKLTEAWRAEHPDTEPASVLLQRILAERRARWEADLQAKGKDPAKVRYDEPAGLDTESLPELPEGWCWSSLGQCFAVYVGATPSRKEPRYWDGDISWVSSGEVQFCRIKETREHITGMGLDNSSTQINPAGSVLLGMIGEGRTRGQVAILDIAACNNQNCAAIWVSQTNVPPEFIYYWLWSQYEVTRTRGSGNNQPALNKSRVEEIALPLPPLAEQEQIVAEVDRRLSVVSELEATVEANLKRAERLRQSILHEAFAGRLVPQDPNDEPASVLLERIRQSRQQAESNSRNKNGKERANTLLDVKEQPSLVQAEQISLWDK